MDKCNDKIMELASESFPIREIAKQLKMSKSNVQKIISRIQSGH